MDDVGLATLLAAWTEARGPRLEEIEDKLPPYGTQETAQTIWGEGRAEGSQGMSAIAHAIRNRIKSPQHPDTAEAVVKEPYQFSVWNEGNPNREKMESVTEEDPQFREALSIAAQALAGKSKDPTGGAVQYHTKSRPKSAKMWPPPWASKFEPTREIGEHKFYKRRKKS